MNKIIEIIKKFSKKNVPNILPGDVVKVYQKIKDGDKERIQIFEGMVLAKKHGEEIGATITVRKVSKGIGIERIFPIHSPLIQKIEVVKRNKTRRAKLYFLRTAKGKRGRLKRKEFDLEGINKIDDEEEAKEETLLEENDQAIDNEENLEENKETVTEEIKEEVVEEIKEDSVKEEVSSGEEDL